MTLSKLFRLGQCALAFGLAIAAGSAVTAETAPGTSRGAYVATTADCSACHTAKGGQRYAGGYAINSPMGAIYSSNITPSKDFGIGTWTLEDFTRAVRDGVSKDGTHLYPAMPYPSYAKMTDADIADLYDYFMHEVAPVDSAPPVTELPFPFSQRWSMIGWNLLYAGAAPHKDEPGQSAEWNRGKYLVEGPAHCDTCHTPRDFMMGPNSSRPLAGGMVGSWYAPNLTPGKGGIGDWSATDLAQYLQTGIGEHARASGPMAEAVEHSFQHMSDEDIAAMVTYLRSLAPIDTASIAVARPELPAFVPADLTADRERFELNPTASGAQLYETVCASCHGPSAKGSPNGFYPALVGNQTLEADQKANLLSVILEGTSREVGGKTIMMPGFGADSLVQRLSDDQIATLATYVATTFGDHPVIITEANVATARAGGPVAPLVRFVTPLNMAIAGILGLVVLLGLVFVSFRLRRVRSL